MTTHPHLTPQLLLEAYRQGIFPMARSRQGRIDWYSPDPRAVLPLDQFRVTRSLRRRVAAGTFQITFDHAFARVIAACAEPRPYAAETWISGAVIDVYTQLHELGIAHSVEAWRPAGSAAAPDPRLAADPQHQPSSPDAPVLAGGLYGLALGGAFFGESMFTRQTDASKVCLVNLVTHLRQRGFTLLDVQFTTPHLARFGIAEIPRDGYLRRLAEALALEVIW